MGNVAADADSWVRRFRPAPDAFGRLVCMPHAGGSASYFLAASRVMAHAVDVLSIQYPGRQDRRMEPCIESLDDLADQTFQAIAPWADRPTVLFGHSLGGVLAFETARRMEARGIEVSGLFISGRYAPGSDRRETIHLLDDDGLVAEVRSLGGSQPELHADPEIMRAALPAIRSDFKAAETYRYQAGPKLRCPVVTLVGDADPKTTVAEADGWREFTDGGFEMQVFSGDHFYLNSHATAIFDMLAQRFKALEAAAPML